jgi:mRNA interferase HigB
MGTLLRVRILGRMLLDRFTRRHDRARRPLARWEKIFMAATWKHLVDLQGTFASPDLVGEEIVFNIGGNKYRLAAIVDFKAQTVLVTDVQTHGESSKRR